MPLFEYKCQGCGHQFEQIVHGNATPACPACRKGPLEKLISSFAVGGIGGQWDGGGSPGACGSCGDPRGPGACSMN